jgi:MFS family permease
VIRLALPIGALLTGIALLLLGTGLLNTLLPVRGELEGYTAQVLGLIMSNYFVGFLIGTRLGPRLIRRIGHIRAFAFCAALVAICTLLHALWIDPYGWALLRIVTGTGLVILYMVIESWLNAQTGSEQRGQVFAIYMMVNLVALASAQQLIRIDSPLQFTLFAISALFITMALMPITLTRLVPPTMQAGKRVRLRRLNRKVPVAAAGAVISGLSMGAFWGMAPVYVARLDFSTGDIAGFLSATIIGGAILQYPLGRYSDTHDRRSVIMWTTALAGICALLLAVAGAMLTQLPTLVMLAGFIYGGFAFAIYPLVVAHLADQLDPNDILEGSGALLMLHGVGAALGPTLAGALITQFGASALPLYFMVTQWALTAVAARDLGRTPKALHPAHQSGHYVPMVRTTPEVMQLHPDQDELDTEASPPRREAG